MKALAALFILFAVTSASPVAKAGPIECVEKVGGLLVDVFFFIVEFAFMDQQGREWFLYALEQDYALTK